MNSNMPHIKDLILMLDDLTIQSYLVRKLKERYYPIHRGQRETGEINRKESLNNISQFREHYIFNDRGAPLKEDFIIPFDPKLSKRDLILNEETGNYVEPINENSIKVLTNIAQQSVLYFRQGKELLQSAQEISEFSSPILYYYSYLQIIKGLLTLEYQITDPRFFKSHGLTTNPPKGYSNESGYPIAKITGLGVFQLVAIMDNHLLDEPSVSTLIDCVNKTVKNRRLTDLHILFWLLSSLVRYSPEKWQFIISGTHKDELIRNLRNIINELFPSILYSVFNNYRVRRDLL